MNIFDAMKISASGLDAMKVKINVISSNLANVNSTRSTDGLPYRRKDVVLASQPQVDDFQSAMNNNLGNNLMRVDVAKIVDDDRPFNSTYEPGHPDADKNGFVLSPNINVVEEMIGMISAIRAYESNVMAVNAAKGMAAKALEIGR